MKAKLYQAPSPMASLLPIMEEYVFFMGLRRRTSRSSGRLSGTSKVYEAKLVLKLLLGKLIVMLWRRPPGTWMPSAGGYVLKDANSRRRTRFLDGG